MRLYLIVWATAIFFASMTCLGQGYSSEWEDLWLELNELQVRVAALQSDAWLDSQRREETRFIVTQVLADADSRSSLLRTSSVAGWDDGFFIGSADRSHVLRLGVLLQPRDIINMRRGEGDGTRYGFEHARTRLIFSGHVFDPVLTYRVQGQFLRSGGAFAVEDAYVRWEFAEGWSLTLGQFRIPLLREILVARSRQQLVERSLVHAEFTAGRSAGVSLERRIDRWRFSGAFTDGLASTGGFNTPALAPNVEYALSGRVEHRVAGSWSQFDDYTSWPDEPFGFMLGAAVHYQSGESGAAFDGDVLVWTVDASAEFGGANIFSYIAGRRLDDPTTNEQLDQIGAVVQGGLIVAENWEVFTRYEWADSDRDEPNLSIVTAGVTHFFARHRLKWTFDVGYGLRSVAPTWGSGMLGSGGNPAGWRTDNAGRNGQVVVRNQLQVAF